MTTSAPSTDATLQALKERARATWSAGDYDAIANGIWEVGDAIVRRAGIAEGEEVLDVACGTGNAAIQAALAGGRVTGLDLAPQMFEAGRRRAAEAGADVTWIEADAEAQPFEDGTFDVVLSTFGVMFAPRHVVAAREMARVLRPGGRIGLATWTPEGTVGGLFATMAGHLPPAPEIAESPMLWGVEEHVRQVFANTRIDLAFERRHLGLDPEIDVSEATAFYISSFGPLITARELLEPQGRWEALALELGPAIEAMMVQPTEYMVVTGTKRG
ncbi:MAG: class I SAM-dependent methyltransferase [Candidatus Limnocylindria bacterium]